MRQNSVYEMERRNRQSRAAARARAAKARKMNTIMASAFMAIVIFACFIIFGMTSNASSESETCFKYYTDVMITYDCGIVEIAEQFADDAHYSSVDDYIAEVCRINHFTLAAEAYDTRPGDHIIVPYYSEEFK